MLFMTTFCKCNKIVPAHFSDIKNESSFTITARIKMFDLGANCNFKYTTKKKKQIFFYTERANYIPEHYK